MLYSFFVNIRKDCAEDVGKITSYKENIQNLQDSVTRLDIVENQNSSLQEEVEALKKQVQYYTNILQMVKPSRFGTGSAH